MGKPKSHSNFFSSPSTPSSPTPTSNSGEVRVQDRVPGWGGLLTTGLRRRAGGGEASGGGAAGPGGGGRRLGGVVAGATAAGGGGRRGRARAAPELRRSPSVPAPGVAVGLGGVEREKLEVEDEGR